jgi:glycosyltransferase involved in cell wall biosynthesis
VRVLFVTTVLPGGGRGGGEVVSASIVAALREAGHQVSVLGYQRPGETPREGEIYVGRRPIETSSAGARAPAWLTRALVSRAPYSSTKYRSRAYLRAFRRALDHGADLVVVDHVQMHFALDVAGTASAPVVFVAHNADGPLYHELAAAASGPLSRWVNSREERLLGRIETQLADHARQVWTLTDGDASYFRSLCPAAEVRTLEVASSFSEFPHQCATAYDVALIGSWSWKANQAGLEWFLDEVVPLLGDELTIAVAGAGSEGLGGRHPQIAGHGVVPDAREFLARARVVAVPSLTGGGIQVKTLDAIATGIPVVATPVAVRALADLPATVAVAEQPSGFARELRRLAAAADREHLGEEAAAWSRARSARLKAGVARWVDELAGDGAPIEPSLVGTQRSRTRTG